MLSQLELLPLPESGFKCFMIQQFILTFKSCSASPESAPENLHSRRRWCTGRGQWIRCWSWGRRWWSRRWNSSTFTSHAATFTIKLTESRPGADPPPHKLDQSDAEAGGGGGGGGGGGTWEGDWFSSCRFTQASRLAASRAWCPCPRWRRRRCWSGCWYWLPAAWCASGAPGRGAEGGPSWTSSRALTLPCTVLRKRLQVFVLLSRQPHWIWLPPSGPPEFQEWRGYGFQSPNSN